jgi:hypothetical protein
LNPVILSKLNPVILSKKESYQLTILAATTLAHALSTTAKLIVIVQVFVWVFLLATLLAALLTTSLLTTLLTTLLARLAALRITSRRLLAEILAFALSTHIPLEIIVFHSVICHLSFSPLCPIVNAWRRPTDALRP